MADEPQSLTDKPAKSATGVEFEGGFSNQNMHHTSRDHLNRLQNVIIKSTLVGGLYGALISIPSELFIRWRSPLYRAFGFRIRVFYHTIWIASAAAFHAENEVIRFENMIRQEEEERRRQLLELSIIQGQYTPELEGYKTKK
jgi:hypothetical protein